MRILERSVILATLAVVGALLGCSRGADPGTRSSEERIVSERGAPQTEAGGAAAASQPNTGQGSAGGGAAALPPGHPPIGAAPGVAPPPAGSGQGASGLTWSVPRGWTEEPPSMAMRRAQLRVPRASGDSEDGECVVFYFGPGQGGTPESNASRWVSQFAQPDGSSSEGHSKIEKKTLNGAEVTFVEVKGSYVGMSMPGMPGAAPKPDYALLGAIVPGPDAPWFFKFIGPAKTVESNRAAFDALIASVKRGA